MRDRSWRRAQRERAIARVTRNHKWLQPPFFYGSEEERHEAICRAARTPKPCSRYCCGNPRKWFDGSERLTLQEYKANLELVEQLRESHYDRGDADINTGHS